MHETDRLTSYLDGALDPDQEQALEAELAGDAALRAQLAALQRVDAALALIPETALPKGARQRLDARLAPAVDEVVTAEVPIIAAAPTTAAAVGTDELARRRRRRLTVSVGGVAAGLAVLVVGLGGLDRFVPAGGDDDLASLTLDADDDSAEMAEMAPESAADGAEIRARLPDLPVVLDDNRRVAASGLDLTLAAAPLRQVAAAALSMDDGQALAATTQRRLVGTTEMPAAEADGEADGEADEADDADVAADAGTLADRDGDGPALITPDGRLLEAADAADVRRCLTELLEAGTAGIPVLIELLEVDGVPAVQVGLVTPDATSGAYTRTEVWTLDRATCQPLRFAQS